VLIVEDDFDFAEALRDILQAERYEVQLASSADEALKLVAAYVPNIAIIDLGLPFVTGYDLIADLRVMKPLSGCQFLAVTGYTDSESRQRSQSAGFHAHLTKPIDVRVLLASIGEHAGRLAAPQPGAG
jgi:DNA-binding response OmpR family regulator